MAYEADKVVVELIAKVDGFDGKVTQSATNFEQSTKRISKASKEAEQLLGELRRNLADALAAGQAQKAQLLAANIEKIESAARRAGVALGGLDQQVDKATRFGTRHATSLQAQRAGMTQLGFQAQDVAQQFALGVRPMTIFAQQGGQVIQALQVMGGGGSKFLSFLAGPWGIGLSVAAVALSPLIAKLFETKDGVEELTEKLKEQAEKTANSRRAQEIFRQTLEGVTQALDDNQKALDGLSDAHDSAAKRALQAALAAKLRLEQIRNETQALLDQARAQIEVNQAQIKTAALDPRVAGPLQGDIDASLKRIDELEARIKSANTQIARSGQQIADAASRLAVESGQKSELDLIKSKYDRLIEAARVRAVAEGKTVAQIVRQTAELRKQQAVEEEAARKRKTKAGGASQIASFIMPVSGAITSGFGSRTPPTKGASSFHPAIDIAAPLGTPVKAAAGGVVVTAGRLGGLGNVVIVDHGGGTISEYGHLSAILAKRGQTVGQGDVIGKVGSTGISTGPHLDYRVRVNGKYVDPRKGQFPVDELSAGQKGLAAAERAAKEAARAVEEEQRRVQAYLNEKAGLEDQVLDARQALALSAEEVADFERQIVEAAHDKYEQNVKALEEQGKLLPLEAADLIKLNDEREKLRLELVKRREAERKFREQEQAFQRAADFQKGVADTETELLQSQSQLATTARERLAIEQRLIDIQFQEEKLRNQYVIDWAARVEANQNATAQEKADAAALAEIAKMHQGTLAQRQSNATTANNQQNAGPLQSYFGGIPDTADEINEAFEMIAANGLQNFTDALTNAIVNFESLREVARAVLGGLASDLIKLAVQQVILHTIGKALQTASVGATAAQMAAIGAAAAGPAALVSLATGGTNAIGAQAALTTTAALAAIIGAPKAAGGRILGPGSDISDNILTPTSRDEFVIKARSARNIGYGALDYINRNGALPGGLAQGGPVSPSNAVASFSRGGAELSSRSVQTLRGLIGEAMAAMPDVSLYTSLDPSDVLQRALGTKSGRRALIAHLGENSTAVRSAINQP